MTATGTATRPAPRARPHATYRHEAVLHAGDEEFLAVAVDFVGEGTAAGQPVLVVLPPRRAALLVEALVDPGPDVHVLDLTRAGPPGQLIGLWREFLDEERHRGRPLRGLAEGVHARQRSDERLECELQDALLALAVEPDTPFWLRCLYDTAALPARAVAAAEQSHPVCVAVDGTHRGSTSYGGAHRARTLLAEALPAPPDARVEVTFGPGELGDVRAVVARLAHLAGLPHGRAADLELAVHELASNTVRHAGGHGLLRLWRHPDDVVCEVADPGCLEDPLAGRVHPALDATGGRGLWLVHQLCDLVQVRSGPGGTTVRVTARL